MKKDFTRKIYGYQLKDKQTGEQYLSGQPAFPNFRGKNIEKVKESIKRRYPNYIIQRISIIEKKREFVEL